MAIPIKNRVKSAVDLAFALTGELLRPGTFKKIIAYAPDPFTGALVNVYGTASVNYLPLSFSSQDADGVSIVYGDEKWLVKGSELAAIDPIPFSGDWFEIGGVRYDVRAALLDPTGSLWTFQIRRTIPTPGAAGPADDWGDLTAFDSNEAWGDLGLPDSADDWNVLTPAGIGPVVDWGDLTTFDSNEGWGDLTLADSSDDWALNV